MTALVLLLAFAADMLFGDPPNRIHPVALMGRVIGAGERLNAPGRPRPAFVAGLLLLVTGGLLFSFPLFILQQWTASLPGAWLWIWLPAAALLKTVFSLHGLFRAGEEVASALETGDIDAARRSVSWHLVSRSVTDLPPGSVASAAVESVAENLTDSFISPLFYFMLAGLPGAWAFRFVNTADAMIGYRTERYEYFGKAVAVADSVLNWIPARIGGWLIVAAAAAAGASPSGAARVMRSDHGLTQSPNAGWTMAAVAGALGVRLEKQGAYVLNAEADLPGEAAVHTSIRIVRLASLIWLSLTALLLLACNMAGRYFLLGLV